MSDPPTASGMPEWDRLVATYERALELPEPLRPPFIVEIERDDPVLAREVRSLLEHDEAGRTIGNGSDAAPDRSGVPPLASVPETVGRYPVESLVGEGGSSTVYRGRSPVTKRPVAIKVLHAPVGADDGTRGRRESERRFDAEVRALGRLRHPGIVPVLDAGTAEVLGVARRFIVMDLVLGTTLTRWADSPEIGRDPREVTSVVRDLAEAVAHAQSRGIIHRDLKPANVLVETDAGGDPVVRVLDFGIARLEDDPDAPAVTRMTRGGEILGTLGYLAPEQLLGDPEAITTATDVHALGLLLHEALVGGPAIDLPTGTFVRQLRAAADARPDSLRTRLPGVDEELAVIVDTALARRPEDRYASAAAFAEDLARWLDGVPITARPVPAMRLVREWIGRHRLATTVGAILATILPIATIIIALALARTRDSLDATQRTILGLSEPLVALFDELDRTLGADGRVNAAAVATLATLDDIAPRIAAGAELDGFAAELAIETSPDSWEVVSRSGEPLRVAYVPPPRAHAGVDLSHLEDADQVRVRYAHLIARVADDDATQKRYDASLARRLLALALEREHLAAAPDDPARRRSESVATIKVGDILQMTDRLDGALALFLRALEIDCERAVAGGASDPAGYDDYLYGLTRIAYTLGRMGRHEEAATYWMERIWRSELLRHRLDPDDGNAYRHAMHGLAHAWSGIAHQIRSAGRSQPKGMDEVLRQLGLHPSITHEVLFRNLDARAAEVRYELAEQWPEDLEYAIDAGQERLRQASWLMSDESSDDLAASVTALLTRALADAVRLRELEPTRPDIRFHATVIRADTVFVATEAAIPALAIIAVEDRLRDLDGVSPDVARVEAMLPGYVTALRQESAPWTAEREALLKAAYASDVPWMNDAAAASAREELQSLGFEL